jgi:hypothetical protein
METDVSADLAAAKAATALLQIKYSDSATVGIERSRRMTSDEMLARRLQPPSMWPKRKPDPKRRTLMEEHLWKRYAALSPPKSWRPP